MRRLAADGGAVAIVVALLSVVLFGFAALVIDIGALYYERRQLQVGADAAALAVAQSCAAGDCGAYDADAELFSDRNALDGASRVTMTAGEAGGPRVCGTESAGLPACTDPPTDLVGSGYVRVTTSTEQRDGTLLVPPFLAQILVPGYEGSEVDARAVAVWGAPGGIRSDLPFTFSNCEWDHYTDSGATYPGTIDPSNWPENEALIFLAGSSGDLCPDAPSGGDSSGGFGWLGGDTDQCSETTQVGDWIGNNTGVGTRGCDWSSFVRTTVYIPVFDCNTHEGVYDADHDPGPPVMCHEKVADDNGTSVEYHIIGYAAFYMTGIHIGSEKVKSLVTGDLPCTGNDKCISGFFSQGLLPPGGRVTNGAYFGAAVVGLAQ